MWCEYTHTCKKAHTDTQTKRWRHCFKRQHIKWTLYTAWNFHGRCRHVIEEENCSCVCVCVCLYSWTLLYFCICTRGCCTRCVHTVCVFVCVYERLGLHSAPDVLLIHRWQRRWNISCQPREAGLQKLQFSLLVLQRPSLYFNSPHLHTEGGEDAHCVSMCARVCWCKCCTCVVGTKVLHHWFIFSLCLTFVQSQGKANGTNRTACFT